MWTLYKKELASFFSSLIGYLTIAVFLILTGLMLWVFKGYLNIIDYGYAGIDGLFAIGPYLYLFLIPAITMKMIAEERRGGTMETLMTHPLNDWTIVWAKFLAAWTLVIISLLSPSGQHRHWRCHRFLSGTAYAGRSFCSHRTFLQFADQKSNCIVPCLSGTVLYPLLGLRLAV